MENFNKYFGLMLVFILAVFMSCEINDDELLQENQLDEEVFEMSENVSFFNKGGNLSANGQATLIYSDGRDKQHFSFNASIDNKGNVKGVWESKALMQNVRTHGKIDCILFVDDNIAIMSGTISQVNKEDGSWPNAEIGSSVWFKVIDNGEGALDDADQFSDYYLGYDTCVNWNVPMFEIESGNIQVNINTNRNNKLVDIEGNSYKTVQIGNQIWMAENLKTTTYNDGTQIPSITDNNEWFELADAAYSWYNNDFDNYGQVHGALYNWYAVETGKLAPTGWHVPTAEEWMVLVNYIGGETEGGKLKEIGFDNWNEPNGMATNEFGFSAFGSGYRSVDGSFVQLKNESLWWSSTSGDDVYEALSNWLGYNTGYMYSGSDTMKRYGYSIRCIKD